MTKTLRFSALLSASALAAVFSLSACDAANSAAGQGSGLQSAATSAFGAASQSASSSLANSLGTFGNNLKLPSLSNSSTSNLAGVLKYCITNNLTSGNASSLLSTATQQAGISSTPSYAAGQQGILQTAANNTQQQFSLSSLAEPLRQKACSLIQSRLQNIL